MKHKVDSVDYDLLAARFISDVELSSTIQQNVSFVEKYLYEVATRFDSDVEREIVYRELGSIIYSCIEALLKSALYEIDKRCRKRKCKENCKYRRCGNSDHVVNIVIFLNEARLFGLSPSQIHEIRELNELRNYIHISKKIGRSHKSICFNVEYVERMLNYYYELLNQLDLADYYFNENNLCLRDLDGNDIDITSKYTEHDIRMFYTSKLLMIIDKLFSNKEISEGDEFIIKTINNSGYCDVDAIGRYIKKESNYSWRYCKTQEEVDILIKKAINRIATNKILIKRIIEVVD